MRRVLETQQFIAVTATREVLRKTSFRGTMSQPSYNHKKETSIFWYHSSTSFSCQAIFRPQNGFVATHKQNPQNIVSSISARNAFMELWAYKIVREFFVLNLFSNNKKFPKTENVAKKPKRRNQETVEQEACNGSKPDRLAIQHAVKKASKFLIKDWRTSFKS